MVRPSNQRAYTVANGMGTIAAPVQEPRDPTSLDVDYTLYQTWQNTSTKVMWQLVSFTSTSGTVLANWVQLATSANSVQTINVDAATAPGTNPVVPSAGAVTITGAQVASGTVGANVVRTDSLSANSLTIEVQRSAAVASTDSTKNGVSHFDSAEFSVDTNGFVTLKGGQEAIDSFIPDSGTSPVVPAASGSVTMSGSGSITTVGGTNTLTTQLTGLTNHSLLVGAGTATITNIAATANTGAVLQNNSGADPSYSTATYPSTTTINQLLYSSAANTVTGLATANRAVLTTGATGVPVLTALATNGQLIIGSTAGVPAAATLTAGTGVSITNGSNSITISTTGSGFTWTDNSGTFTAAINNGYFLTAASTATLPASPSQGDAVEFVCDTTGSCVITANTGQSIRISNQISSVAGTATNSARGDSLSLVYRSATTTWFADAAPNGGWTTA